MYLHQGRKELMPAEIDKALKTDPDSAEKWLLHYHWANGGYAEAEAAGKQALNRQPLNFAARMCLGEMLREQGDISGAIREQLRPLDQGPQNIHVRWFVARAYMDSGDLTKARQTREAARPEDRQSYGTRLVWGRLLALEGKPDEARKQVVAEYYSLLGESNKALDWLEQAVRAGDDRADWLGRNPKLAKLRNEPRFQEILASVAFGRKQRGKQ